jgi:hypothetical protein
MIEQVTQVNTAKESETFDRPFPLRDTFTYVWRINTVVFQKAGKEGKRGRLF